MSILGQVIMVLVSILFTTYQKLAQNEHFFSVDFFIFTAIAWVVGWQYDLNRSYVKKARASEESYKKLVEALPESIIIYKENKIIYVNKATVTMVGGKNREEIIGKSIFDFMVHEYKGRYQERIKQAIRLNQPLHDIEYKIRRFDGSTFFFEASSLSIDFGGKKALLTVGKDITERKDETVQLIQKSEKLALLGQMAAGIAHEIRNPLTSIYGFIQLFQSNHLKKEYFDIVFSELKRINSIVSEFLVLSKPTSAIFVEQDIKVLIKDVVTLIHTQSNKSNAQIFTEFERDLPKISCEGNRLKQVFLNLLKNSIEAMPTGGKIDIKVSKRDKESISIFIIDQGIGIPKDRIPTLGEPFYTTKEKGTGLGLMICFKIIEDHKGVLTINSTVNKGTTIEIRLPTITQTLLKRDTPMIAFKN